MHDAPSADRPTGHPAADEEGEGHGAGPPLGVERGQAREAQAQQHGRRGPMAEHQGWGRFRYFGFRFGFIFIFFISKLSRGLFFVPRRPQ